MQLSDLSEFKRFLLYSLRNFEKSIEAKDEEEFKDKLINLIEKESLFSLNQTFIFDYYGIVLEGRWKLMIGRR